MGTGIYGGFGLTYGYRVLEELLSSEDETLLTDYNAAGSKSVRTVLKVNKVEDSHNLPMTSEPNSVTKNLRNGITIQERYYDEQGQAYLDIDYTDHGNRQTHSKVPHQHNIWFDENGDMHRSKGGEVEK